MNELILYTTLSATLKASINKMIAALPDFILVILILLVGYLIGEIVGKATNSIVRKVVEEPIKKTAIGKKYQELGIDLSNLTEAIVKTYVFVVSLIIALPYMHISGEPYQVITSIVYYLPKLLGGIVILVYGSLFSMAIAGFVGETLKGGMEEEKGIPEMVANTIMVGLIAVFITIALNLMEIGGGLVYTLILGVTIIGLGAIITNALFKDLEESEGFKEFAGYGKFLLYTIFVMTGVAAIFQAFPGTIAVLTRLAWGVAIAFGLILIPLVYKLAKQLTK